jgi:hypothetical protein
VGHGGVRSRLSGKRVSDPPASYPVIAPQTVTTIGNVAFNDCFTLPLFHCRSAAIGILRLLVAARRPLFHCQQAQTIGILCLLVAARWPSVTLPQATSIGAPRFTLRLADRRPHGPERPGKAAGVFEGITPPPPNVYGTDPQATAGVPRGTSRPSAPAAVRRSVTAQAYTLTRHNHGCLAAAVLLASSNRRHSPPTLS